MKQLNTADEVIDALGGTVEVARRYELASPQNVSNWRRRGIPPRLYLRMKQELAEIGCDASAYLWGIEEPAPELAVHQP